MNTRNIRVLKPDELLGMLKRYKFLYKKESLWCASFNRKPYEVNTLGGTNFIVKYKDESSGQKTMTVMEYTKHVYLKLNGKANPIMLQHLFNILTFKNLNIRELGFEVILNKYNKLVDEFLLTTGFDVKANDEENAKNY